MLSEIVRISHFINRILLGLSLLVLCATALAAEPSPEITINGGPEVLRDNVRQYLTIADENCAAPLWRLKALLSDGENEIEQAAQALGYYQLKFTTKLTQERNCWQLTIALTPGEQVKVTEFRFVVNGDGVNDEAFTQLLANPEIRVGDNLDHGRYENLKNRITNLATSHGYFDGRFEVSRIVVNPEENTSSIELIYDTDVRYRIGEIRMQHDILDEKFLGRYLNIKSGDYYDADKLLELKTLYNASNYFSVATASPDLQNLHEHKIDIDVKLEERKRHAYSTGFGVDSNTGPRVLLGYEDRYINSAGHSLNADISASKIKKTAEIGYTIPMARPSFEFVKIYTGFDKEETDTTYSNKNTLGASYTYYLESHWLYTYAFNIENETSHLSDGDQDLQSHLLIPSISVSRTQTDGDLAYPLNGWSVLAKLSGSPKSLGSDISYEQFYFRGKFIYQLPKGRLLLRTELGLTDVNDLDRLPVSVRYFAGGSNSVRGYNYKSLGPYEAHKVAGKEDSENEIVGGNNLLVNSIEYDYKFKPTWAAAAFIDVGNAADDLHLHFKRGVGVGLRWISPVGPIRIDVARGLDDPLGLGHPAGWNLHISMGPDL